MGGFDDLALDFEEVLKANPVPESSESYEDYVLGETLTGRDPQLENSFH